MCWSMRLSGRQGSDTGQQSGSLFGVPRFSSLVACPGSLTFCLVLVRFLVCFLLLVFRFAFSFQGPARGSPHTFDRCMI